ncbi:MAG: hypothetical protein IPK18_03250 [Sphingobacteriales bacterium]|jgi:hypothetical protein|nr:MAG: hypothetical protein IPK18_03250 [Sphingobacteriales bacterium]
MKINKKLHHVIYATFSLTVLFLFFRNYTEYLDVSLLDESGYLLLSRFHPIIYPGGYGALYILCYKIAHQFISNDIQLHYTAIIFLTWLPSVVLCIFLYVRRVPWILCVFLSWCLMLSSFIAAFDWWPRISHFAISFLLLYAAISYYLKFNYLKFLLFGALVCGVLAFARPELLMSAYLLIAILIVFVGYQKFYLKETINFGLTKWNKIIFTILFLIFSLFFLVWKSPIKNTGRAYFALGQHYAFNVLRWENKDMTYFIRWPEIFEKKFGKSRTFKQMYKNNPAETKRHVIENIKHYFEQTYNFIPELWIPKYILNINSLYKYFIFIVIFIGLLYCLGFEKYKREFVKNVKSSFIYLLFFAVIAAPPLFASFIIFPREHYFIMQLPLFIYVLYILISPFFDLKFKINPKFILPLCLIIISGLVLVTPHISKYPRYNKFAQYENPSYVPYINYIKSLGIKDKVNLLTIEFLQIYLPNNFAYATEYFTNKPFYDSLVVAKDINMIYLSSYMENEDRHQSDSTFQNFMYHYKDLNWEKIILKDADGSLFVKKELLK